MHKPNARHNKELIMQKIGTNPRSVLYMLIAVMLVASSAEAQRMRHRSGGFGGFQRAPERSRSMPQERSINGGHQISPNRDFSVKDAPKTNVQRNKTNIDNSKKNVNINVNNSKNVNISGNTVVRRNTMPYRRPPVVYGGFHFYCYHPYFYHPYRPFYWGPVWHPWGFFIATIAATAIIVSVENQHYYYDQGVYYIQSSGGYTVVQAPVGATVTTLPTGTQPVVINQTTTNYYYGGTYYEKTDKGYTVVPPTAGAVVENLPEGGEEVKIGDVTYVKVGDTYYQPIQQDGKNMYEVVDVQKAEDSK
jgi:hypothetical protein